MRHRNDAVRAVVVWLLAVFLTAPVVAQAQGEAAVSPEEGRTYGTSAITWHTVGAWAFTGFTAGDSARFAANPLGSRYCAGAACSFNTNVLLPDGARLRAMGIHGCLSTGSIAVQLLRFPLPEGSPVALGSFTITPLGVCRNAFADLAQETIDNFNFTYHLQVVVNGTDEHVRFSAARVGYFLQVSPAPAVATFNDVPTGHPFFPFIQAMVAAGISGGCSVSPPLYCPDNFVTRGQMAVFISRALGLHFSLNPLGYQ